MKWLFIFNGNGMFYFFIVQIALVFGIFLEKSFLIQILVCDISLKREKKINLEREA